MLVDAHIHTSGISTCSRVSPEELAKVCHEDQLDAIVLTNHCKLPPNIRATAIFCTTD